MTSAPEADAGASLVRLVRNEGRIVLASLARSLGDLGLAEDAVQDAVVQALTAWSRDGVPANPRAWLLVTARSRAVDRIRREARRPHKEAEAVHMSEREPDLGAESSVGDDLLRLIFTCCHPALSSEAQVALGLRTLCGLTIPEVARALLVSEATMAKRLTRARQKIALAGIPYRVPAEHELPDRLATVATTAYLVFNEGFAATAGDHLRPDLAAEAIRLARLLVGLLPGEASLQGLLELMLLQHARTDTRVDDHGRLIPLADQDRSRWDAAAIEEGVRLVGDGLRRTPDHPDRYVVQAAIAGCHALARSWPETDWNAIVSWYDVLATLDPSPVVLLNRAAASPNATALRRPWPWSRPSPASPATRCGTPPGPSYSPDWTVPPRRPTPCATPSPSHPTQPSAGSSRTASPRRPPDDAPSSGVGTRR